MPVSKNQIQSLIQSRRFEEARELCRQLCDQQPGDAEAWFLLGALCGQLGDFVRAEQACRQAIALRPDEAALHHNLGIALLNQSKPAEAVSSFEQATRINPHHAQAHADLGNALQQLDRYAEAVTRYEQALSLQPDVAPTYYNLANALRRLDRWQEAFACLEKAVRFKPEFEQAWRGMGELLIQHYQYDKAVEILRQAVSRLPDSAGLYLLLGVAHQEQGEVVPALSNYRHAVALEPGNAEARACLAGALGLAGQYDEARELLLSVLDQAPDNLTAAITLGHFAGEFNLEATALPLLEKHLARQGIAEVARSKLAFAAAKIHDRRKQYDTAFERYRVANAMRGARFDPAAFRAHVETLKQQFSREFLARSPRATNRSDLPIFIVGMPRSGTSLVEQILASHPQVFGAGELSLVQRMTMELPAALGGAKPYPQCAKQLTAPKLEVLAQAYLAELQKRGGQAPRVTDKAPVNFLHLGLLDMLFPGTRIIHCVRDPFDTCLSCYFQPFSGDYSFAYDLGHLGAYYRLYENLMAHWRQVLRLPVFELRYEDLVADQEKTIRALIGFCGLDWDDRCLKFYETERTVATASFDQVRKPIYAGSVGRWKRYEAHLEPLMAALKNWQQP
jgi:Flp pilus assembly protein TadD